MYLLLDIEGANSFDNQNVFNKLNKYKLVLKFVFFNTKMCRRLSKLVKKRLNSYMYPFCNCNREQYF